MTNPFVNFLTAHGFTGPRQTTNKDAVELVVFETMQATLKKLRSGRMKFVLIDKATTQHGSVQEFFAIQDRVTVGRVIVESFATYSVIQLINLDK